MLWRTVRYLAGTSTFYYGMWHSLDDFLGERTVCCNQCALHMPACLLSFVGLSVPARWTHAHVELLPGVVAAFIVVFYCITVLM